MWPTKISLHFFGDNFCKIKETFKIFSPQILEVYRILLVETTLESIMFYYTGHSVHWNLESLYFKENVGIQEVSVLVCVSVLSLCYECSMLEQITNTHPNHSLLRHTSLCFTLKSAPPFTIHLSLYPWNSTHSCAVHSKPVKDACPLARIFIPSKFKFSYINNTSRFL